jgi:hypothetical protein
VLGYLRMIGQQLAAMGLDWDLPPYPPEAANAPATHALTGRASSRRSVCAPEPLL